LSNWPLPSPSATPKSTSYQHFNSPKAESPSAFADAFYTPSITGQCSPDLTPVSTHQPTFHPFISRNSPLSPDDPKFHCNVSSVSQLPLPPVDPSKRLSSSPNPQLSESESRTPDNPGSAKSDAMNPFQLQTPPHGDERGHLDPQQHHQHGHVSTPVRQTLQFQGNTFNTPTLQPPFPNTGLQISPDMYNYPSAPASAPPVPHGVFNWDQSPTIGSFDGRMMNSSHSSFASGPPLMGDLQNWHGQNLEQNSMLHRSYAQQSAQLSQAQQEPDMWLTSNAPGPQDLSSFSQSPSFPQPTTGVNPNLIFSFSSPPQTINPSHVKPNPPPSFDPLSRQPYEQQMRESTREREITKKARHEQQLHHNRSSSSLSTRPSLQRSNTDSGFRRNKNRAMDTRNSAVQALQAAENIPRKPSPLKRLSQVSLSSIPEGAFRLRPRTRLVIDDSGTARTETVTESDDDAPKRLSFGHWPDEDSSEEDAFISSQRNSLVFSSDLLRPTKHARIDSDDEDGGLYKRPLSSTSLSSLTSRMGATPLGRKISMDARRRLSQESQSSSLADRDREVASSSQDTILGRVSDDDDSGDAQNALKKLVGERMRRGSFASTPICSNY